MIAEQDLAGEHKLVLASTACTDLEERKLLEMILVIDTELGWRIEFRVYKGNAKFTSHQLSTAIRVYGDL